MTSARETIHEGPYGPWAGRVAFMLPRLKRLGMTQQLTDEIADWAATMWPHHKWEAYANATCSATSGGFIECSSDHYK